MPHKVLKVKGSRGAVWRAQHIHTHPFLGTKACPQSAFSRQLWRGPCKVLKYPKPGPPPSPGEDPSPTTQPDPKSPAQGTSYRVGVPVLPQCTLSLIGLWVTSPFPQPLYPQAPGQAWFPELPSAGPATSHMVLISSLPE